MPFNRLFSITVIFFTIAFFTSISASAQTKITFNVDMKPMLEDSSFIPGQDILRVKGDLQPFTRVTTFQLNDEQPIDSVYSVTINFPRRYTDQTLTFNYFIQTLNRGTLQESLPRYIELKGMEISHPPYVFNTFPF